MKIRLAKNSDTSYIYSNLNSVKELRDYEGGEEYPLPWVRKVIRNKKDAIVLLAQEKEEIVGFIIAFIVLAGEEAIINNLYVKEEYRRKGLGSKLISECEIKLKKRRVDFLMLQSQIENTIMHNFSQKQGYERGESFVQFNKWLK